MKSIRFHRYRPVFAACTAALFTTLAVPLATASDSLASPGAAAAALHTPLASLGDDGKDMKEMKEVKKEAGRPSVDGYLIHVACPCGAVLDRWVTPEDARHDLVHTTLLSGRN